MRAFLRLRSVVCRAFSLKHSTKGQSGLRVVALALLTIALLCAPRPAAAAVTYTYTGNPLTEADCVKAVGTPVFAATTASGASFLMNCADGGIITASLTFDD